MGDWVNRNCDRSKTSIGFNVRLTKPGSRAWRKRIKEAVATLKDGRPIHTHSCDGKRAAAFADDVMLELTGEEYKH